MKLNTASTVWLLIEYTPTMCSSALNAIFWSLFFELSPSVEVRKRSIIRVVVEVGVVVVVAFCWWGCPRCYRLGWRRKNSSCRLAG